MASGLTEAELDELQNAPSDITFSMEQDRGRVSMVPDESARKALRAVPRLVGEVRRLRGRVQELEEEESRRAREARRVKLEAKPEAKPAAREAPTPAEELAALLAAPFRVSPRAAAAAKDDPLAALAVQVARSLADDAGDVERARLIAMAFAAAQGNMDAFWQARKQRSLSKLNAIAR
jgi:hypothetical protein